MKGGKMEKNKKVIGGISLMLLSFFDWEFLVGNLFDPLIFKAILIFAGIILAYMGYKEKKQGIV